MVAFIVCLSAAADQAYLTILVHDDYVQVGEDRFETVVTAKSRIVETGAKDFEVKGHLCADTKLVVEIVDFLQTFANKPIRIASYGEIDDPGCGS